MPIDPAIATVATLLLATVFAIGAVAKLRAPASFAGVVANYRLLPDPLVRPFALTLPVIELVGAAGLLWAPTRAWAATLVAGLLLAFAAAMAVNLARGRYDIDCGCAIALLRGRISWPMVARNLVLAAAAFVLALGTPAARGLGPLDFVTVAAALASVLLLCGAVGRLFGLAPVWIRGAG